MAERIPVSTTVRIALKLFLSSDHVSVATGKTVAVVISKNGGAFANPSAGATNATEIGNGWYYVDLSTTDTGTAGPLIVRGTASSCDDTETVRTVGGGIPVDATTLRSGVGLASANLDTQLSTIAGYIDTEVAAIKAKTDNLPASPAGVSDCLTAAGVRTAVGLASANLDTQIATLATASSVSSVSSAVASVQSDTDDIQTRIPAALVGGRMDSNVQATAAALAFNLTGNVTGNLSGTVGGLAATPSGVRIAKNASLSAFEFPMFQTGTGTAATGATVTAQRSLDGGAFANMTNSVAEVGSGVYRINLAAADTNANTFTYKFTATGCDPTFVSGVTEGS